MSIIDDIDNGHWDGFLDEFQEAINHRRRILRAKKEREVKAKIDVDSFVKLSDRMKPKYLSNRKGVVVELRVGGAVVSLDCGPVGKFSSGRVIVPFAALEVVE